ncbi:cytochrome c oxidase accessory protein CcoG [Ectothiorhodospira haloalkaliphila]|uniref:cytochrome c oxidase accessory protein CcoG n=1 Tax=Ectothiorhodospira haloalkaliphila TaxID=421628 RepID=UPI001EE8D54C|nr:cytochrome c oxidase accessory protein CcoG [Ectothiorhodospira haloalkaliphila]MCG5523569.1 cytochrome c oxidase accessory protein CcoG [Ectothiorhodospira haloalkaliphila]
MPDTQYQARIPIYPRAVKGRFRNLKWSVLALAYGVYFLLPWLRWEREHAANQAVLFDIPGRRFYLFDLLVHPQDIFWLAALLIILALLLFMVTGIAGRVFCGYFCFQTLWTDVFMLIERWLQGDRAARMRLAERGGPRATALKGATHGLWLLVAFATGLTFTLYWANAPDLVVAFFTGQAAFAAYATAGFLTITTYLLAGLLREQVCTYMCPYARFQSVMFDKDTLIVSYDAARGEGSEGRSKPVRGLRSREERQARGVGDCIDCGYCVQVCPVGIDIRDGLQYQCIHCALCVDACDTVMDGLKWPRGLVRYTSENALEGRRTRYFKPKTIGYAVPLVLIAVLLGWGIAHQTPLDASVSQVRQPLFVQLSDGSIQNSYEIRLHNKAQHPVVLELRLTGLDGAALDTGRIERVSLMPEQRTTLLARVRYDVPAGAPRQQGVVFEVVPVEPEGMDVVRVESQFILR